MAKTAKYTCSIFAVILFFVPVEPIFNNDNSESFSFEDDFEPPKMDMTDLQARMNSIQIDDASERVSKLNVPNKDLWDKINDLKARLDSLEYIAATIESNITASTGVVSGYSASQNTVSQTVDVSAYATKNELSSLVNSINTHANNIQNLMSEWNGIQGKTSDIQSRVSKLKEKQESLMKRITQAEKAASSSTGDGGCPENWLEREGHCYAHFRMDVSWAHAAGVCAGHKAHLLQLETEAEREWIKAVDSARNKIWGGATNAFSQWKWIWAVGQDAFSELMPTNELLFLAYDYDWDERRYISKTASTTSELTFICEKWTSVLDGLDFKTS